MDNSEAIRAERRHHTTPASGAEDVTFVVAGATLGWLLVTLYFATQPLSGPALDPLGAITASAMHLGFLLGLVTPLIALLALVVYRSWKAGGRVRFSQLGSAPTTPASSVVALVALAWLLVSLLLRSEPGSDFTAAMLSLIFTGCLGLVWLAILLPNAYRTWKACGLTKAAAILGYLIPLPLAAIALFVVIPGQAPLKMRFELSEAALTHYVEQFERTNGESASVSQFVGLYNVGMPYRRDGCVILPTQAGLDYLGGLAYCSGRLPHKSNVDLDHIKGQWWTYEIFH